MLWSLESVSLPGRRLPRLDGVTLAILEGVTAILGQSGCGKTSLLNLLVGYETPSAGKLVSHVGTPAGRLSVFWVPPHHGLWTHLTVREHLTTVAQTDEQKRTVDEFLAKFDLQSVAGAKPDSLSLGESSRLSVARAVFADPDVLVMDEPLSHVDGARCEKYWNVIREWYRKPGKSLIFATHVPEVVIREASQVICLSEGRVAYNGSTSELYETPNSLDLACQLDPSGGQRVILKILMLFLMFGLSGCQGSSDPIIAVKHESTWLMPPEGTRIPAPRGMTVSPTNEHLVLDNVGRVLVFNDEGDVTRKWWMPEYSVGKPEGVCVLKDGRIAVADTHYHRVVFFDSEGNVTGMFGQHGSEPGDFVYPVKITQDPDENIYVCEYGQNDRVQKFRPDGTFLLQFGGPGTEPGQFQRPSGIVWYDHELFVVDAFNNRVQVFKDDGQWVAILGESDKIAEVHYPYDIAVDKMGDLFVVEYGAGRVSKFNRQGHLLGRYGRSGLGQVEAQFSTPWGLSVDRRGRLYVCDTGNRRLVELEL